MSMNNKVTSASPLIEWGVAARAFDGRAESGDQYLVEPYPSGILVVVVDGLGHGHGAAVVAKTAVAALEGHAHEPIIPLLKRCHKALRGSRGVVMSLASFNALGATMTWLGVGNVIGLLLRADARGGPPHESLLPRGGVVGYRLPMLRPAAIPVMRGDTLIFATDGIRNGFAEELFLSEVRGPTTGDAPQKTADHILAQHGQGRDDALVLVARYVGFNNASMRKTKR